ncbi:Dml1p [Sporobolomyces koalae]|uniref:Dml1p n=1 Tax=Sporobolomyces koalae TaxID=500713 RepID=UPI00316EC015
MEAVLITRNSTTDAHGNLTTSDLRLEVTLAGKTSGPRETIESVPASEWARAPSRGTHPGVAQEKSVVDLSYKPHAIPGFSAFGTDEPNEFATFTTGREIFRSSQDLREECEDDLRSFAEKSDHTEGFMLSTSISDGFGGFTSSLLEMLRDEFPKSTVWTTAMISDSRGWNRTDNDRSQYQRLVNAALSMQHLEELSSMLLPIQPATTWTDNVPWTKYLRDDLSRPEVYSQVLNTHLQSANSELREPDCLTQIVQQLNWRGDNKIATLCGAAPMLSAEYFSGAGGIETLKKSSMDWSTLPDASGTRTKKEETPFAQYGIVRGFEFEDSQALGTVLEKSTSLQEPLSQWVSLPQPYPILPSSLPIYRGLLPNGRPLVLEQPSISDPSISAGLFGLPDTRYPLASTYTVQPNSIPILTTLSTSPASRHLLSNLSNGIKELVRIRSGVLREFEDGEYGLGREGILECRERLETLADTYRGATGTNSDDDVDKDEDENWDDTEDTWDL